MVFAIFAALRRTMNSKPSHDSSVTYFESFLSDISLVDGEDKVMDVGCSAQY